MWSKFLNEKGKASKKSLKLWFAIQYIWKHERSANEERV
jgi:hypothetical protein